jgi:predicted transcriptional regulator
MKLTPQHHKAIELMVMGSTNKNVAETLNIAPETVSRWKSDYEFQAELNRQLREQQQQTQDRLRALANTALSTIEAVMSSDTAPEKDRLHAAFKVLEMARVSVPDVGSTHPHVLERDSEALIALEEFGI